MLSRAIIMGTLLAIVSWSRMPAQEISCPADEASAPALQTGKDPGTDLLGLKPQHVVCDFHLHSDSRSILPMVLGAYGIQTTVDASVESRPLKFEMDHLRFKDADELLKLATGTFFVTIGPTQILAVADTKPNRTKYEHQIEQQISIPGLSSAEVNDMQGIAKTLFLSGHAMNEDSRGRITVRAPEAELTTMDQAFHQLFDGHSELLLDVQVCEVDHTKDRDTGLTLPSSTTVFNLDSEINSVLTSDASLIQEIVASGLASASDYTAILAILVASGELSGTVFNDPFAIFGGGLTESGVEWSTPSADILLNTSNVKTLSRMQLRVSDHEEGKFFSGEHYPIMTASYSAVASNLSTTGSTVTVPQIEYEDLGMSLKVKPSIESKSLVGLNLDLQISSLAGSSLNDIPVLNHRQYAGNVMVHFGNSALITSTVSRQDASSISGTAGLPTSREDDGNDVELVVMVTPHLVRFAHPETASTMWLMPIH